ncbi:MAG: hypothetical protein AAFN77_19170 [Planctomycetota bacterium]
MPNLRFLELLLVSRQEKASRRIRFNKNVTILKGRNDTGKSSVMKSIYKTLGGEPPNVHSRWEGANVISSLRFEIDGTKYRMLRTGSRFTMFDATDKLIQSFTSVTNELGPYFAELFTFHLTLASRSGEQQATPAFLFLPFYVDQDQGWQKTFNSFERLQQFKNWQRSVPEFHTGIRPSEYYVAKARLRELKQQENEISTQRTGLEQIVDGIRKRIQALDFDIDLDAFKKEIEMLLSRSRTLRAEENKLKKKLVEAFNNKQTISDQLDIVRSSLEELRADRKFATELQDDEVTCPTCNATYDNGFAERFEIAVDEDRCIELISELEDQLKASRAKLESARTYSDAAKKAADEIESLLATKRKKVALQDVLRREGQKDVTDALQEDIAELNKRFGAIDSDMKRIESEIKTLEDKKRAKAIKDKFTKEMGRLVSQLNVPNLPESAYKNLHANIKETGSDLPRAILAYYLALNTTIREHGKSTLCPLVVDSPRQQDQDEANWQTMLETIRSERGGSQLILALVDDLDVDFGGTVVELKNENQVLQPQGFAAAMKELSPLIDSSVLPDSE